ncbi:MAG TPA: hypothetical protein PKD83_13710 [Ignavibacteria bacterium]|nr:hypothetical protein [Ignavibacteria bacterium]
MVFVYLAELKQYTVSIISGWVISFLNVLAGSIVIYRAFQSAGKGFFNIVLLSMIVRMFSIAVLLFVLIYFFKMEKLSLAISLFFFYFLFMIFEISFLNKNRDLLASANKDKEK